jgi:DNA polymerase IV
VECVGDATDVPTLIALLHKGFVRRQQPVRLLGVGVRLEVDSAARHGQFDLFSELVEETDTDVDDDDTEALE